MSKYYVIVKDINKDYFDPEDYYSEFTAKKNKFALISRDGPGLNTELYKYIFSDLEGFSTKLDKYFEEDFDTDEEAVQALVELVENFGKGVYNKPGTPKEVMKLVNLAEQSSNWYSLDSADEAELICDYLEIVYSEPFKTGIMQGETQVRYVCPKSLSDEYLKYIEAVVMKNGVFAYVTNGGIDDPTKELSDELYDNFYFTEYYIPRMSEQDLKDYFAKKLGLSITNIEILTEYEYNNIIQA